MLLSFGGVAPEQAVADTKVLLQFPAGADPEEAIRTDLEVLRTHAVAQAAVQALGLETDPEILRAEYDGAILTNRILSISAAGNDAAEAERQADAVAAAYLQVREALYREQGDIVVASSAASKRHFVDGYRASAKRSRTSTDRRQRSRSTIC